MSEPEIARRCPECGASIRDRAMFCPQCGLHLSPKPEGDAGGAQLHDTLAESSDTLDLDGNLGDTIPISRVTADESPTVAKPRSSPATPSSRKEPGHRGLGHVGAQLQRATTRARDVKGDVLHRSQKLKEISSVVIDEAGYDPSLRFVLVAAGLFVLFLIIVLLNKLIA